MGNVWTTKKEKNTKKAPAQKKPCHSRGWESRVSKD